MYPNGTIDWDAAHDQHLIDSLQTSGPGPLTEVYRRAAIDEWNGEVDVWNHWGEITLALSREAVRVNDAAAWPDQLTRTARRELTLRACQVLGIATEHTETRDLHDVRVLRATLRGLRSSAHAVV